MSELTYVRFFEEIGIDDVPLVGGKNASLGEMYRELSERGGEGPQRLRDDQPGLSRHARAGRCLGRTARSPRRLRAR